MNQTVLTTIAITGFTVAFFHAAIPTHWLPFVLTARAQRWNRARTLGVTALAGSGHAFFTALLGLLIAWFGITLSESIGAWFPRIAGGALLLFGLFYLFRQLKGHGHAHSHFFHRHGDGHQHDHQNHDHGSGHEPRIEVPVPTSDRAAIISLLTLLTFSPCEGFLPIYVSGVRYGWIGFALLTAILSVATVAGMLLFTFLTLTGMQRIKLAVLEKYESGIMGGLLCLVAILIILFEK